MAEMHERFAGRFTIDGECRRWRLAHFPNGYGKITVGSQTDGTRRIVGVHRVAYELMVGPIPHSGITRAA